MVKMTHWETSVRGVRYWLVQQPAEATVGCDDVAALLQQWAFDGCAAILHDLAHHLGVQSPTCAGGDAFALADRLASMLGAPLPQAVLCRESRPEYTLEPPPEQVDIGELLPPVPLTPPEPSEHWIEVVLLDSGEQPIGNERFELVLPDGKVQSGRTDDDGLLRVDPIFKAGNCRLYFPDLQAQLAGSA